MVAVTIRSWQLMAIQVWKLTPEFKDKRGFIARLIDQDKFPLHSVLYIKSKKGTVRANHYHTKDVHYVFCVSGRFRYWEKDMRKAKAKLESVILKPGDMVLTQPMVAHAMEFLADTVFLAFTTEGRSQKQYEQEVVRIELVPASAKATAGRPAQSKKKA